MKGCEGMREIKYRAWDIQTESMIDVLVIDWVNELIDLSGGIIERRPHEVVLMQFTGLEDKNGKEICDGDILKAYPNNTMYIGKVYYEDGQWFGACDYLYYSVAYSGAEVIGNIYENQELLEEEE